MQKLQLDPENTKCIDIFDGGIKLFGPLSGKTDYAMDYNGYTDLGKLMKSFLKDGIIIMPSDIFYRCGMYGLKTKFHPDAFLRKTLFKLG